ncbi:hypothetical protein HDU86_003828 [Geranomyces michiganensis]|nr:hypothetical protein HDU86_003828 [Geranomyces michiganensis]
MGFTPEQNNLLEWVARGSASLSFCGILCIYVFFIMNPTAARNPTARLIIFMATSDLMSASAKFLGRWPITLGIDRPLCKIQAAVMQEGDLSSLTWTAILAANLLLVVFFRGRTDTIRKYELRLALFAYGWPLIFALLPLVIRGTEAGGPLYGDSNLWCWIVSAYPEYQIGFFYIVLWMVFLFNLVSYLLVFRVISNSGKALETYNPNAGGQSLSRYRVAFARTALVYSTAAIVVWTPSNLNRFYAMSQGHSLFALSFMQTLMSPMRGFINFVAYFCIYRMQLARKQGQSSNGGQRSTTGPSRNARSGVETARVGDSSGTLIDAAAPMEMSALSNPYAGNNPYTGGNNPDPNSNFDHYYNNNNTHHNNTPHNNTPHTASGERGPPRLAFLVGP